ncbi:MAG: SPFH domain-containing protein [Myxococcota bacterium]
MGHAVHLNQARPKATEGWRRGRPVEDPEKMKRWGVIAAKPSEFLVHVRKGRVLQESSGQGASCFKWPADAVSIIPTSLQQLRFSADQVTKERVGVEVVGLAVYRIADPLTAYRVLNFSYPERAQEKLEATLTAMLIGATRRLVANLSLDDCLGKRKAALADELLLEVAPVLGGRGRIDDDTDQGWGVVLDTIEIEEVRVSSEKVFAELQAPYRALLEKRAAGARADTEREAALTAAENRRLIEAARLQAERAVIDAQSEMTRRRYALQVEEQVAESEMKQRHLAIAAEEARVESEMRRRQLAIAQEEAELELAAHEQLMAREEKRAARESIQQAAALSLRQREAELRALEGKLAAEVALAQAGVEQRRAEAEARVLTAKQLPHLANAVGQRFGEVKVTQIGNGDRSPFGSIAEAIASVIELSRSV